MSISELHTGTEIVERSPAGLVEEHTCDMI